MFCMVVLFHSFFLPAKFFNIAPLSRIVVVYKQSMLFSLKEYSREERIIDSTIDSIDSSSKTIDSKNYRWTSTIAQH